MLSSTTQHLARRIASDGRRRVVPLVANAGDSTFALTVTARTALVSNPRSFFTGISRTRQENANDDALARIRADLARGQFVRSFATTTPRATTSSSGSNNKNNSGSNHQDQERKLSSVSFHNNADANKKDGDDHEETYREKAEHYRDQAREGAHNFGGMMKQYGPVFVGTYLSVYAATLGALFAGIQSGAIDPAYLLSWITGNDHDVRTTASIVAELLEKYPWTEQYAPVVHEKPYYANLAVAWVATKFTEPLRLGATAVIVRPLARQLGMGPYRAQPEKKDEEETKVEPPSSSSK